MTIEIRVIALRCGEVFGGKLPVSISLNRQSNTDLFPLHAQSDMLPLPTREVEPGGHGTQESAREDAHDPVGHCVQFEAPKIGENDPYSQGEQAGEPSTELKDPGAQGWQGPPFRPAYPTLHEQFSADALPIGESESEGQVSQVVPPVWFKYVPGEQSEHLPNPLAALKDPALHCEQSPAAPP